MSLEEVDLNLAGSIPPEVSRFLREADRRCDAFFDSGLNKKIPRFLPANYELVYLAISELREEQALLGNRFCEWGSGLGTATALASILGFEASGIEIEQKLVSRAKTISKDFRLGTHFLVGSFLPEGFDFLPTQGGIELMLPPPSAINGLAYPDCDWSLDEVDLFYAYPWPEEQEATLRLFESVACDGSYLLCYFGDDELCAYVKQDR